MMENLTRGQSSSQKTRYVQTSTEMYCSYFLGFTNVEADHTNVLRRIFLPLLSAPPAELSGVGSMSSKPQDTLCLPPRRQDGEPGPPSRSKSLKKERLKVVTQWGKSLITVFQEN